MKRNKTVTWFAALAALTALFSTADGSIAQERRFFSTEQNKDAPKPKPSPAAKAIACKGPIANVMDFASEDYQTTSAVFGSNPGGGEGGQFDKTPVLSAKLSLTEGNCLDAHFSAIVGSKAYGLSSITLFQVTLTPLPAGAPRHMVGHYELPYGMPSPAVALEAESDADMIAANFFQRVGKGPHEVPPGLYRIDVWWAGAPPSGSPGGAIGAAFVLKLYMR